MLSLDHLGNNDAGAWIAVEHSGSALAWLAAAEGDWKSVQTLLSFGGRGLMFLKFQILFIRRLKNLNTGFFGRGAAVHIDNVFIFA
jgi:hypothetical protein